MVCTKHDDCRGTARAVRRWMSMEADTYRDPQTGEPNYTACAEGAAHYVDHDEWLDDPDHPVWEWAVAGRDHGRSER